MGHVRECHRRLHPVLARVHQLAWGLLLGLSAVQAHATVTFSLTLAQEVKPAYHTNYAQTWFYATPTLSDTNEPLSYHRVESPTESCSANFGTNTASTVLILTNVADFFDQLTNGNWKLWLNRDTPEELLYTFTISSSALTTNPFGPIIITAPRDGAINVSSNTPYIWIGPTNCDTVEVAMVDHYGNQLAGTETNWNAGPVLNPGTNFFQVAYRRDATLEFTISTPTNDTAGLLTNWAVEKVGLDSLQSAGFMVEGLPPSALAQALDAPGLVWETSGNANWFPQTTITRDGLSAARSGVIADDEFSTLRTLIYGTNTITFWWKSDSEASADYVEFSDNGIYVADLTGNSGWQKFTYQLAPGTAHWLEWTYYKDWADVAGADAVFLDQVRLAGNPGFPEGEPLTFSLTLSRSQTDAFDQLGSNQIWFTATPALSGPTNPISYHRVAAPNDFCSANFGPTNSESILGRKLSFEEFTSALTNGNWQVWLNKETPEEQCYPFTLTALNFSSNDLGVVIISTPLNGATNVSAAPPYEWSGLPTWDELFIAATQERFETNHEYASDFPDLDVTSWSSGPNLASGTNHFLVRYRNNSTTNFFSTKPFLLWDVGGLTFESVASSGFIVPPPAPAQLLDLQQIDNDLQFQFESEAGRTHVIQSCVDLGLGLWQDRTNLIGDGMLQTILLPIGSEPAEFFRVSTQ